MQRKEMLQKTIVDVNRVFFGINLLVCMFFVWNYIYPGVLHYIKDSKNMGTQDLKPFVYRNPYVVYVDKDEGFQKKYFYQCTPLSHSIIFEKSDETNSVTFMLGTEYSVHYEYQMVSNKIKILKVACFSPDNVKLYKAMK